MYAMTELHGPGYPSAVARWRGVEPQDRFRVDNRHHPARVGKRGGFAPPFTAPSIIHSRRPQRGMVLEWFYTPLSWSPRRPLARAWGARARNPFAVWFLHPTPEGKGGIEPPQLAWKASALPLCNFPKCPVPAQTGEGPTALVPSRRSGRVRTATSACALVAGVGLEPTTSSL